MHLLLRSLLCLLLLPAFCISVNAQAGKQNLEQWNTKQPTRFIENKGQVTDQDGNLRNDVKYIYAAPKFKAVFKANCLSYEVFSIEKKPKQIFETTAKPVNDLLSGAFNYPEDITINTHRIDIKFPGAKKNPEILVEDKTTDYNNYYLAHTPEEGVQKVCSYTKLTYKNIWPNIDIVFYVRKEGQLKYDIVLHPGSKLSDVKFEYDSTNHIQLNGEALKIITPYGTIEETIPYSINNNREVDIKYLRHKNTISFSGDYNSNETLVIDPLLSWVTFYGGDDEDYCDAINCSPDGYMYGLGRTKSISNIAVSGQYQTSYGGGWDVFLVKFDSSGSRLWATYYGGNDYDGPGKRFSFDMASNIYIAGSTYSTSGIATSAAHQQSHAGNYTDGFLVKFDGSGQRKWATYYGGNGYDFANGVKVSINGNIYMAGHTFSTNNIATSGSYQSSHGGKEDMFLVKFDSLGVRQWGTYYGGTEADAGNIVSTDSDDAVYIFGITKSSSAIATGKVHQSTYGGGAWDGFLVKLSSTGKRIWGTYYGGNSHDNFDGAILDSNEYIYLSGYSVSTGGIATTGAYQTQNAGGMGDGFIVKFDTSGKRIWGTYYGGMGYERLTAISINSPGNLYVIGYTESSTGIATKNAFKTTHSGKYDLCIAKFDTTGNLKWGTYYGGKNSEEGYAIATDGNNNVYVTGYSYDLPTTSGAHQAVNGGGPDAFFLKFKDENPDAAVVAIDSLPAATCTSIHQLYIRIKNLSAYTVLDSVNIGWSINNIKRAGQNHKTAIKPGDTSTVINLGTMSLNNGINTIKVWTYNPNGSVDNNVKNDTFTVTVNFSFPKAGFFADAGICIEKEIQFTLDSTNKADISDRYLWLFGDGDTSISENPTHIYSSIGNYKVLLSVTSSLGCTDTFSKTVTVYPLPKANFSTNNVCIKDSAIFTDSSISAQQYIWSFGDGNYSILQNPSHYYETAGTYTVTQKVRNIYGCWDSTSKQIEVYDRAEAIFSVNDICVTDSFHFTSKGKGATAWHWKFGDDAYSYDEHPKYKYSTAGKYDVWLITSSNNGCKDSVMHAITVDSSCVWPGDANADKIVDNKDILAIGLAFADTGSYRADTSTLWKAHHVKDWSNNFSSGQNYKHADSDGNGTVSYNDTLAVTRNYTRTHAKKQQINRGKSGDPVLKIDIQNDSLKAGDTLVAYIVLGENALPAKDVYGLAFSINYNQDLFSAPVVDFSGNWFGNNILTFNNTSNGLDIALSRTDHNNISGAGNIASIKMVLRQNVTAGNLKLRITDNMLISASERILPTHIIEDSVKVYKVPNNIRKSNYLIQPEVNVYPNPFINQTVIEYSLVSAGKVNISLFDINGRAIQLRSISQQTAGKHLFTLNVNEYNLPAGVYLLRIDLNGIQTHKRIVKVN